VKERKGPQTAVGALDVAPTGEVRHFVLLAVPPGGSVADFRIDAAARMGDSVRARQKRGEYDAVTNGRRSRACSPSTSRP
jgi:hypothetical protein